MSEYIAYVEDVGGGACREIFLGGDEGDSSDQHIHDSCVMKVSQIRNSMPQRGWCISQRKGPKKTFSIYTYHPLTPP